MNVPVNKRVCVSPPPYYLDWFEVSYPNVPLNWDEDQSCLQYIKKPRKKNPTGRQHNQLLDAVVTIIKYKKSTIDHAIYIKVLSDVKVSYLTVSTDDVINTTNNETEFHDLRRVFEEDFEIKLQEISVLKYLNLRMFQSPFVFSVYHTDNIFKLVNAWFSTEKNRRFNTSFRTDYTHEKELINPK